MNLKIVYGMSVWAVVEMAELENYWIFGNNFGRVSDIRSYQENTELTAEFTVEDEDVGIQGRALHSFLFNRI